MSTTAPVRSVGRLAGRADAGALELWDDVLRAYAGVLDEQRALLLSVDPDHPLDLDGVMLPSFLPPVECPPLPDELRGRAMALLAETEGLAALARDVLAHHPAPNRRAVPLRPHDDGSALDQKL